MYPIFRLLKRAGQAVPEQGEPVPDARVRAGADVRREGENGPNADCAGRNFAGGVRGVLNISSDALQKAAARNFSRETQTHALPPSRDIRLAGRAARPHAHASGGEKLAKYTFTGEISGGFYGASEIFLTPRKTQVGNVSWEGQNGKCLASSHMLELKISPLVVNYRCE